MRERGHFDRSQLIGELGLLDNAPALERSQDGLGGEVGDGCSREEFYEIALVGALSEVVGIVEGFD